VDRFLSDIIDRSVPRANPFIMEGLGTYMMRQAEEYVDTTFKSAAKGFPAGLEYVGYERCTPNEEYNEVTRPKNNKRVYDLAKSDIYLMKFYFKFGGVPIPPRYMYLPFVTQAGLINLGGNCFHLSPVMSDKVISPSSNSVFIRLQRDRINFDRTHHTVCVDGANETVRVVWSKLHRKPQNANKTPITTKAVSSIVHYLLAKYGYTEMCNRYLGFVPVVGTDDITVEKYPPDQFVICESSKIKPATFMGLTYVSTELRMAIPKEKWDYQTKMFVGGIFYVFDHFPTRMRPEHIDNKSLWMILLGNIIFSGLYGDGKLHDDIKEHLVSLNQYLDTVITVKLKELGYDVGDFYDLLALTVKNFDKWVSESEETSITLFGKTLEVLYYALYDITSSIFKTNFKLNKLSHRKILTSKEVIETMNKELPLGAVYGLTKGNIAVTNVAYSGDNMYPKITSVVALQQVISGANRGRKTRMVVDSSKRAHPSMLEVGSILFLSKSNPTPAVRANMYMHFDPMTGTILPKPHFAELQEKLSKMLKG